MVPRMRRSFVAVLLTAAVAAAACQSNSSAPAAASSTKPDAQVPRARPPTTTVPVAPVMPPAIPKDVAVAHARRGMVATE
jgi:ABC-type transport system substrate-binding protein